jgi:hypothetical protein
MKIKVTKKHINDARPYDGWACMVHEAVVDAFQDVELRPFFVDYGGIYTDGERTAKRFSGRRKKLIPLKEITPQIKAWDRKRIFGRGNPIEPFEFEIPDEDDAKLLQHKEVK